MLIDNLNVEVVNGTLPEEELGHYVSRGREKYGGSLRGMHIKVDGEYVDITYDVVKLPFQRIRRITGYLVGTMDRWNDSKCAEEADRLKHCV